MIASRKHYEALAAMDEAGLMDGLAKLKGRELLALQLYALGREQGDTRDGILICLLMQAGDRYLAKVAGKQRKKAKRIL